MMKQGRSIQVYLWLFLLFGIPVFGQNAQAGGADLRWLAAGPFPVEGRNALFRDYLAQGEARARAAAGAEAGRGGSGPVRWTQAPTAPDGAVDLSGVLPADGRAVAYAYTEISVPAARTIVAAIGSGVNIQVRLNGEILLESRISRKPEAERDALVLPLKPGLNTILVKIEGGGNNRKLPWTTHRPAGKLFVNQRSTIVPDFRTNEAVAGWGQVEVVNAGGEELTGVVVEALGDDLVFPSRSDAVALRPFEVRPVPVWISSRRAAAAAGEKPIRLRVSAGGAEQIVEFRPRVRKADGYFVATYRSAVDGSVQPFSVLLPTSLKKDEKYPLVLLLHGAHVTDWGQNIISYDAKEWAIQVAVHDRGNNRYRDIGEVDIDEVLAEVKRRYAIDAGRIYLAGHSMGGYGTWFQAVRRPDLWASISPQAGYADYFLYHPAMSSSPNLGQVEFQRRLLESWSPLYFVENLLHVPAYVVHGAKDDNVTVEHSRRMAARLKELGYDFDYHENPEGGHWWGPRGRDYGTEIVDSPRIWDFLRRTARRAESPKKVIYSTDTLHYRKAYWVEVDELERANRLSRIEAEIAGPGRVSVKIDNIREFTLDLGEDRVDADREVEAAVNGRTVFRGMLPHSRRLTLRHEQEGRFLQILDESESGRAALAAELDAGGRAARFIELRRPALQKSAQMYGKVSDAFNKPFLFVVGTQTGGAGSAALNRAAERAAETLAREWMMRAEGIAEIKRDVDVTQDDIESRNLILFGNAATNRVIARINEKLPIRFSGAGLAAGSHNITAPDLGMVLIVPNPIQTGRYAVVVGGTTPASFETAARLNFNELPDFVVFDGRTLAGETVDFVGGGFFNKFWELDSPGLIERGK